MTLTLLAIAGLLATGTGQQTGISGFAHPQPHNIADLDCAAIFAEQDRTRTCEILVRKIMQNYPHHRALTAGDKMTHDNLYQHYQTMNCQNMVEMYHQHPACGSVYNNNDKWSASKNVDMHNTFCPEKTQRQLNVATCKFIVQHPKKIDVLYNCIDECNSSRLFNCDPAESIPAHCEKAVELSH